MGPVNGIIDIDGTEIVSFDNGVFFFRTGCHFPASKAWPEIRREYSYTEIWELFSAFCESIISRQ